MRALNLHAINDLRLDELEKSVCKEDEVLVKLNIAAFAEAIFQEYTQKVHIIFQQL